MKILAVNTANSVLSLALVVDGETRYFHETSETRDQGNVLISHAQKGLQEAGLTFADLGLLAVVTGPGSFTGIRIGIAALRGIALAAAKPLVGISSFDLFTVDKNGFENIVCLESFREELYIRHAGKAVNLPPQGFAASLSAGSYVISGDAAAKLKEFLPHAEIDTRQPDARDVAMLAAARFVKDGVPSESPVPFYLRDADVSFSTKIQQRHVSE